MPDIRTCKEADIKSKAFRSRFNSATDASNNVVKMNDIVELVMPVGARRSGTVKHINAGFLFLHSRCVPRKPSDQGSLTLFLC